MLGYGEEVAKEKIRCKYLPPHSHSFSKEQNLHLLESIMPIMLIMPYLKLCLKRIRGIEDAFYAALTSNKQ